MEHLDSIAKYAPVASLLGIDVDLVCERARRALRAVLVVDADVERYLDLGPNAIMRCVRAFVEGKNTAGYSSDVIQQIKGQAYGLASRLLKVDRPAFARGIAAWIATLVTLGIERQSVDHVLPVQKVKVRAALMPETQPLLEAMSSPLNLVMTALSANRERSNSAVNRTILGHVLARARRDPTWQPAADQLMALDGAALVLEAEKAMLPAADDDGYQRVLDIAAKLANRQ